MLDNKITPLQKWQKMDIPLDIYTIFLALKKVTIKASEEKVNRAKADEQRKLVEAEAAKKEEQRRLAEVKPLKKKSKED